MVAYPKAREMLDYDQLPASLRAVVRSAPFDVSVSDMLGNTAVMRRLAELGEAAPAWLSEQLLRTYRTKIAAPAFI